MSSANDKQKYHGDGFENLGPLFVLKRMGGNSDYSIADFVHLADVTVRMFSSINNRSFFEGESEEPSSPVIDFLLEVLTRVEKRVDALTAVVELYHIDPTYRDLYYTHYSKHFFNMSRFTIRLTFFNAEMSVEDFTEKTEKELSDVVIGSVVLCPINRGVIGRTIMKPSFVAGEGSETIEVRLSKFEITVRGKRVIIPGFIYRQQDGDVMSCAEVSLLNLVCYYANEYREYAVATPSEILALEEPYASERITPTRGLDFYDMSRIMSGLRFYPRVYNARDMLSIRSTEDDSITESDWMNRILSWYITSGIPVAANVSPYSSLRTGHSLVCVGRKSWDEERRSRIRAILDGDTKHSDSGLSRALRLKRTVMEGLSSGKVRRNAGETRATRRKSCTFLDAADFDDQYVVMDDAQIPYSINPLDKLGPSGWTAPKAYMVPLHRSMVLDALQAHENGMAVLAHKKSGVLNWAAEDIQDGERIIVRMFMCSARGYKRSRVSDHPLFAPIYEELVLSHFLWVFELYRTSSFISHDEEKRAFAEIVLDTSSSGVDNPMSKVLFMRYPKRLYVRCPNGEEEYVEVEEGVSDEERLIVPYHRNLECVRICHTNEC